MRSLFTGLVSLALLSTAVNQRSFAEDAPSAAAAKSTATATASATKSPASAAPAAAATNSATPAPAAEPGHSFHGEAFNEGPRQRAYLMGSCGNVHFPVTTRLPLAQQFFDQGVGQLHGFWYFEAERSFRQAAAIDPDCAMAYWGMAMANAENEKRAKKFIAKAVDKKAAASPREAAWIDALDSYYAAADNTDRRRRYVRDLEALVQDNPDDVEAKAFLALQIWKNGSWMTEAKKQLPISSHQAVDAILDQVFQAAPDAPGPPLPHPPLGRREAGPALVSATLCGQTSPGIAHMWHMPGHTFSKLHRYADAAWQQEASARVDHAHMMRDRVMPDQIHNYAHNNEWLIRNLAFLGRVHDAIDLATNMIDLPRHPKYNTPQARQRARMGMPGWSTCSRSTSCGKRSSPTNRPATFRHRATKSRSKSPGPACSASPSSVRVTSKKAGSRSRPLRRS